MIPTFGAHESSYDKRTITDKMLAKATGTLPKEEASVDMSRFPMSEYCNQQALGICTACATRPVSEEAMGFLDVGCEYWLYLIGKTLVENNLWEGSSAFTMLKAAQKYGIPSKAILQSFPLKTDGTYAEFIEHFKRVYGGKVPQGVLDNASLRKIKGYAKLESIDPISIARHIEAGKCIITRSIVGDNTYKAADGRISWAKDDLSPLRAPKVVEGGHLWSVYAYKGLDGNQVIKFRNSWSKAWCDNGDIDAIFNTQKPFMTEMWVIEEVPQELIEEVKKDDFKVDLEIGMNHPDVKRLQIYLNTHGFPVALNGAGSEGKETYDFGPKTKEALIKFQLAKKIIYSRYERGAGRCGPMTRKYINAN